MRRTPSTLYKNLTYLLLGVFLFACSTEKQTGFNRAMENLTARYNILFNANDILRQKQQTLALNFTDNYTQILTVYPDTAAKTATPDKLLESVILRGNTIISEKDQSHYIPDAYILLGKANYMEYNYFNSIEFFSYMIRTYPKNYNQVLESEAWKARALMHIDQMAEADTVLDTAFRALDTAGLAKKGYGALYATETISSPQNVVTKKKHGYDRSYVADIFATRLQYDIYTANYLHAEAMAKAAVAYTRDIDHKLRWTFILAQLQELNRHPTEAVKNYSRIVSSNASFEMAFNASLNRIRVEDNQSGIKESRIDRLRKLLKNENNKEFIDQIYYQIGEIYRAQGNYNEAVRNYKLSVRYSLKNQNQKGLSYLRIADIEFSQKANYVNAKKYYDSTLTNLSPNYPGYVTIRKKADNLQLLGDRLQTIALEDTLQMLARLNDKDRAAKITALASNALLQQQAIAAAAAANKANAANAAQQVQTSSLATLSNFYFYNTNAVAQGYTDFKRIWGNRPLTDNWRRSVQTTQNNNTTVNPQVTAVIQQNTTASPDQVAKTPTNPALAKLENDLRQNVPLTPAQLTLSNTKIYTAYLDIADFYRDVLGDNKEAIRIFELLLNRFPNTVSKPSTYYTLYRLYSDIDTVRSNHYKDLLLKNYPETNFAKVILDPDYNQKLNDKNAAFTTAYTTLYGLIEHKKYEEADLKATELMAQYPAANNLAQVYYLRAIAAGHGQPLGPFKTELKEIVTKFPDDKLVTPLVKQHLAFIAANDSILAARPIVLTDADPTEPPFKEPVLENAYFAKASPGYPKKPAPAVTKPVTKPVVTKPVVPIVKPKDSTIVKAPIKPPVAKPIDSIAKAKPITKPVDSLAALNKPVARPADSIAAIKPKPVVEAPSIFSMRDSTNYYFVIDVTTNRVNLAPSRFGVGQFNRTHLPDNTRVTHQLRSVADNLLIYVGRFTSLAAVKAYARSIVPLLPEIMTVPKDKYQFFIITQQNLDKLADKKTLDSYFDYYQNHY